MTTVYRVQDSEGCGPYVLGPIKLAQHGNCDRMGISGNAGPERPMWRDGKPEKWETMYYAFRTLDQLVDWFSRCERATLRAEGYVVVVFDVSDTRVLGDGYQVVFDLRAACERERREVPE